MKKPLIISTIALGLFGFGGKKASAIEPIDTNEASIKIETSSGHNTGHINAHSVNFREKPSLNSKVISRLNKNTKVTVLEHEGEWIKIQANNKTGYVKNDYLVKHDTTNNDTSKETIKTENAKESTMTLKATAYAGHTITATGSTPKWGTIAVDPSVIPYGSKVYIKELDKVFIAEDTGGAIKGNKIDIFMNSEEQCNEWGIREVTAYIVK